MTSTRNTASAMSACWVIWPPQLPLTALMLITFGEGTPSAPRGPKASNNACFTVTVWARDERLGPDQHRRRRAGARRLHGRGLDAGGLLEDLLHGGHGGGRRGRVGRELDLGAAGEVDAEVEPPEHDRRHADEHEQAEGDVPDLAAPDDVERAGAGVEPGEDRHLRHSPSSAGRPICARRRSWPRRRGRTARGCRTPASWTRVRPAGGSRGTPRPGRARWTGRA